MKYNSNGKFKIMQITDIQEIPSISVDTIKLLEASIEAEKPDLVILTGDQLKGYGAEYKRHKDDIDEVVYATIERLLEPIAKRGIPYAVTFGNHDDQVGISNEEQYEEIYKKIGICISEGTHGAGTISIPIKASSGDKIVSNIYLLNSGGDASGGGYEAMDSDIIKWYRDTRDMLKDKNGDYIPSIVFQHIPMEEYYNVLERVPRNTYGAVRAYRRHKNEYYTLGESCGDNDVLLEPPSIPNESSGELDAISECGDVMAVFVGHDHKNNFVGRYKDIDLGYTPSSGFNSYGSRTDRGVRIIELDEKNPREYRTYVRTYKDLVGGRIKRPILDYLAYIAPETVDATIPIIARAIALVIAIAGGIIMAKAPLGRIGIINICGYLLFYTTCLVLIIKCIYKYIMKKVKGNEEKNQ